MTPPADSCGERHSRDNLEKIMDYYGLTDRGMVRKQNQDAFLCEEIRLMNAVLLIVCDGMGGAKSGNVASRMALDEFKEEIFSGLELFGDEKSAAALMKRAAERANSAVYNKGRTDPDCTGMGTTLVAAIVLDGGAVILNVGDSRAYTISRTEHIRQITRDHSVVEDMIQRGEITRAEAKTHPNRNLITRAIGTSDSVEYDLFYIPMKKDDMLMLCSDGLTNIVDDEALSREMLRSDNLRTCCEGLVQEAIARGAPDNVTAVLYRK